MKKGLCEKCKIVQADPRTSIDELLYGEHGVWRGDCPDCGHHPVTILSIPFTWQEMNKLEAECQKQQTTPSQLIESWVNEALERAQ